VIFSSFIAPLFEFALAVAAHWYALTVGIIFVIASFAENFLPRNLREWIMNKLGTDSPKWVRRLGVAFLFLACFQAWNDEHNKVLTLQQSGQLTPDIYTALSSLRSAVQKEKQEIYALEHPSIASPILAPSKNFIPNSSTLYALDGSPLGGVLLNSLDIKTGIVKFHAVMTIKELDFSKEIWFRGNEIKCQKTSPVPEPKYIPKWSISPLYYNVVCRIVGVSK
jgi:hypothetical protein